MERKFIYLWISFFILFLFHIFFFLSRFCLSETSCSQEDNYPSGLCIKVNGKLFPLPVSDCLNIKKFNYFSTLKIPAKHFTPAGLCTTTKKWSGTEETGKTSKHYLPCPSLLCSTQSDFSNMGTWNWESKNTVFLWMFLPFIHLFFVPALELNISIWSVIQTWFCLPDLFYVCLLGEATDITTAPAEAKDEGHQKPWPLQSTK